MSVLLQQRGAGLEADGCRLAATGEVGFEGAAAMAEAGSEWLAARPSGSQVIFDLSGVDRVSSAALSVLLEWIRQARDSHIEVTTVRLSVPLQRLTRVAELDTLLPPAEQAAA
ncbi:MULTISPECIES: STAS domain-containing protein [Halomonas]|uniref:Anti-anti-sigma factor n=1 Tax=Halomonas ventosae TaxID=229007 RepID=A0A4R6HV64_9GAMM|nr:STAS domain-containing protein [Halomonas ventosae]TDO12556.1 anti-anti-sigma factor [Halomonas ventosae]